jgi:DNA-binding transcriptional LysR family regulator
VYFDAGQRDAPRGLDDYLESEHCSVHYEARRTLDIDEWIAAQGHRRRFAVTVPGFAGIGPFLRGSARLATLPGLLRASLLRSFDAALPPFDCPPMPMYMVWHLRHHADPMHQWLRGELQAVVAPALAAAELPPART